MSLEKICFNVNQIILNPQSRIYVLYDIVDTNLCKINIMSGITQAFLLLCGTKFAYFIGIALQLNTHAPESTANNRYYYLY